VPSAIVSPNTGCLPDSGGCNDSGSAGEREIAWLGRQGFRSLCDTTPSIWTLRSHRSTADFSRPHKPGLRSAKPAISAVERRNGLITLLALVGLVLALATVFALRFLLLSIARILRSTPNTASSPASFSSPTIFWSTLGSARQRWFTVRKFLFNLELSSSRRATHLARR
jgi:hypothetical protein